MSALTYNLTLKQPSSQNIVPVIRSLTGEVLGYYLITKTVFDGTETSITLPEGAGTIDIPIASVTLPQRVTTDYNLGVPQYMAAVITEVDYKIQAYRNSNYVGADEDVNYSQWTMPSSGAQLVSTFGVLTTSLVVGMDDSAGGTPTPDDPVTAASATMEWKANLSSASLEANCAFFDFNWVTLFNAKSPDAKAVSLEVVSNPAGGVFKSTLVPVPVANSQGSVIYNTVRVIRLKPVPLGSYVFTYKITDDNASSTQVTLTLTVA